MTMQLAFALRTPALFKTKTPLPSICTSRTLYRARFVCTLSKKSVIFLGSPPVSANVLQRLCDASKAPTSTFSITAVVTQPSARVGRKRVLSKSPVQVMAESLSIPTLTPVSARDSKFLDQMNALKPDLCITAAYGNFLPAEFLSIPPFGTLNIHPSLLPAFRGAAPIQRALENGDEVIGVSILYTVLKMDAGPILARRAMRLQGHEQMPELLEILLQQGTDVLLELLPSVWAGSLQMEEQDEAAVSYASKISKEEARLTFTENALIVHNKVRAFAGWPGSWADFVLQKEGTEPYEVRLKILKTEVLRAEGGMCLGVHDVRYDEQRNCLAVVCDDGSKIALLRVQPPGKRPMDARSFWNGIHDKTIERKRVPH